LMDEPLSNLDAKLRLEMRSAIKEIQNRFKITTVYVTHDQEEALAISDRIAVMKDGEIQQIGTPVDIYQRPYNTFVATFIGQSNVLNGRIVRIGDQWGVELENGYKVPVPDLKEEAREGREVKLLVRPNHFELNHEEGLEGRVIESTFLGMHIQYKVQLFNQQIMEVLEQDMSKSLVPEGTQVKLKINSRLCNVFDKQSDVSLMRGVTRGE